MQVFSTEKWNSDIKIKGQNVHRHVLPFQGTALLIFRLYYSYPFRRFKSDVFVYYFDIYLLYYALDNNTNSFKLK